MAQPLLHYKKISEYKRHYEKHYCRGEVITFDGIRVYFKKQVFGHAFYENSLRQAGGKDEFSPTRAQRMDWIKSTLANRDAELYVGWNKKHKCYEDSRRVSVVYEDFVVVIELYLSKQDDVRAKFITCYIADSSIHRIKKSPKWNREKCLQKIGIR